GSSRGRTNQPIFPIFRISHSRVAEPHYPPGFFLGVLARGTLFSARIPVYRAEWAWNRILKVWLRLCLVREKPCIRIACLDSGIGRVSERVHEKEPGTAREPDLAFRAGSVLGS